MEKNIASENRKIEKELRAKNLFPNTSAPWQQMVIDDFLSGIIFREGSVCLDAACGIGNNIGTLSKYFKNIIAFDVSENALEFAIGRYKDNKNLAVTFDKGNLKSLDYHSDYFDCVLCTEALEHILDYDKAIKEIFRVLKPGGFAIISSQNHFNPSAIIKFFAEKLYNHNWDAWGTHNYKDGYESCINCFQIKREVKRAGFTILNERGADYINAWLSWIPVLYRNYRILDKYPMFFLGKIPALKYFGMDYFLLVRKE